VDDALGAVGQHDAEVGRERGAVAHRLRDRFRDRGAIVGMHALVQRQRIDRLVRFLELVERAQLREPSIAPVARSISKLPIRARRCALSRCARLRVSSSSDFWRWSSIASNARATSPISSRRALAIRVAKSPLRIRSVACWIARIGRTKLRANRPDASNESTSDTAPAIARFSRE
jgi:hypothetical protein